MKTSSLVYKYYKKKKEKPFFVGTVELLLSYLTRSAGLWQRVRLNIPFRS